MNLMSSFDQSTSTHEFYNLDSVQLNIYFDNI